METQLCQSCGMPLTDPATIGTRKDGTANEEYCVYCYRDGSFTDPECTMDGMIEHCLQFLDQFNKDSQQNMTEDAARAMMKEFFPSLKRWSGK